MLFTSKDMFTYLEMDLPNVRVVNHCVLPFKPTNRGPWFLPYCAISLHSAILRPPNRESTWDIQHPPGEEQDIVIHFPYLDGALGYFSVILFSTL